MRTATPALFIFLAALTVTPRDLAAAATEAPKKFAVFYSDTAQPEDFEPYQLLILDREHHPSLQALHEHGKKLAGYVSLGEVKDTDSYFKFLQQNGMVLNPNPNWPGSYYIDLRNPLWAKTVIEDIIPPLLAAGFTEIFFDTLDSPLYLETENPEKYRGMANSAAELIKTVHMHFPDTPIIVNRAYALLPQIGSVIDGELGESVYADYNFDKKTYGKVDDETYNLQLKWLQEAKARNPKLKIYTLDYADPNDRRSIAEIYRVERENGFIPYVATVGLDRLVDEPSP